MRWFKGHLNWTVGLVTLLGSSLVLGLSPLWGGFGLLIGSAITFTILTFTYAWVLDQKNRSTFWIFLVLIPLGWIAFISLGNHSRMLDVGNES